MYTHSKLFAIALSLLIHNVVCDIIPLTKDSLIGADENFVGRSNLIIQQQDSTEAIWINPCTGEPSNDIIPDDELPCLQVSNVPSPVPPVPLEPPEPPVAEPPVGGNDDEGDDGGDGEFVEKIICPGEGCLFDTDGESGDDVDDNIVLVEFKYTVETTDDIEEVTSVLPQLEETLLKKLAEKLLGHCFVDGFDFTLRNLANVAAGDGSRKKIYRRRNLKSRRRLLETILGICSAPVDEPVTDETCEPELNENNKCFVIEGGVTISIDGDADDEIAEAVTNATKDAMKNDELLTDDNPEVKKVKFLEEDDDSTPIVPQPVAGGGGELPIYLAASFGFLALLIGGYAMRKKRTFTEATEVKTDSSFVGVVGLGNHASTMDVHQCTSATCPKCYVNRGVTFVNAPMCQPALPPSRVFDEAGADAGWDGPSVAGASTLDVSSIQMSSGTQQSGSFDSVDFSSEKE